MRGVAFVLAVLDVLVECLYVGEAERFDHLLDFVEQVDLLAVVVRGEVVVLLDDGAQRLALLLDDLLLRLALLLLGLEALLLLELDSLLGQTRLLNDALLLLLALARRVLALLLLLLLLALLLLLELDDARIARVRVVHELTDADGLLLLSFGARRLVLLVDPASLVAVRGRLLVLLVQVGELAPRVEVVPERVELVDVVERGLLVADLRHALLHRPASVALEQLAEHLVEVALVRLGHGRDVVVERRIDAVERLALHRIGQDLERLRYAREVVALLAAALLLLVRMVRQHFALVYFRRKFPM